MVDAKHVRKGAVLWLATCLGCASAPPPPPLPFIQSPAFKAIEREARIVLREDLDGDGIEEAIVGRKVYRGYVAALYRRHPKADASGHKWDLVCLGPVVDGSDLEQLRWVSFDDGPLLLLVVTEATPDTVEQRFALVDLQDGCVTRHAERLRLPVLENVVGPSLVPGGVLRASDTGLVVVDSPRVITLDGPEGRTVDLLHGVRSRTFEGTRGALRVEQEDLPFLRPRAVAAFWEPSGADKTTADKTTAVPLEMLTDHQQQTVFVVRPGERGTLRLEAGAPIVLVEVRHGCADEATPIEILQGDERYTLGETPRVGGFVMAAGRGHAKEGARRDLFVLRVPTKVLSVQLRASPLERCLREIKVYGFSSRGRHEGRADAGPAAHDRNRRAETDD